MMIKLVQKINIIMRTAIKKNQNLIIYLILIKKNNIKDDITDHFRKESSKKQKDEYDYLFNTKNNNNNNKEDKFDDLFKKKNENDYSNIDSEINKILGRDKDKSFNFNNNYNNNYNNNFSNKYNKNQNNFNKNDLIIPLKYQSQKNYSNIKKVNGIDLGHKPYERPNLKPIINGGKRGGGGGLMAIGYEPNKNSIFNDISFGGLGINRNRQDNNNNTRLLYKREMQPIVMKEKRNENLFLYNNNREDSFGSYKSSNNYFSKNEKFGAYERNNLLKNQFKNETEAPRMKRNFFSSPNGLGWDL